MKALKAAATGCSYTLEGDKGGGGGGGCRVCATKVLVEQEW